ncbi:MAG: hypothetical protein ACKO1N_11270 [Erythrobacter sp.]
MDVFGIKPFRPILGIITGLLAVPVSAQTGQFDLICGYGDREMLRAGKITRTHARPEHLQIDLAAGRWCDSNCGASSTDGLHDAGADPIVLKLETGVALEGSPNQTSYTRRVTYDRATGVLTRVDESRWKEGGLSITTDINQCEERSFSGFVWSKFRPARLRNEMRITRELNETDAGRAIMALVPSGTTPVIVRVQVDKEGRPKHCAASAPSPMPELEAAVCTYLTGPSVTFDPALNPSGEPIDGEYRQTVTFAG